MNALFFPDPFFFPAPAMVAVPFFPAPPTVAAPSFSTTFTIGCDDPADQVRAYMNRPKNVLLKSAPQPVADADEEPSGGLAIDETVEPIKLVFPMKFGRASKDNNDIDSLDWAQVPPAEFLDAPAWCTTPQAHEPSLIEQQPEPPAATSAVPLTWAALAAMAPAVNPATTKAQAAPKKAAKQQARAPAPQWPSEQSVVSTVAAVAARELSNALLSDDLQSQMQHLHKGTVTTSVSLPSELPLGKGLLFMHRLVQRELASEGKHIHQATYQQLGEAIHQRVDDVPFDLHVLFSRSNGSVSVSAKVEWVH